MFAMLDALVKYSPHETPPRNVCDFAVNSCVGDATPLCRPGVYIATRASAKDQLYCYPWHIEY